MAEEFVKKKRILLADDHRIVTKGLRSLLEPEFELAGIVEDDGRSGKKGQNRSNAG